MAPAAEARPRSLALFAPDAAATEAIGAALGRALLPGEMVLLEGELGAGKSALARAAIRARLGDPEIEVPSPSFALVQPYEGIVHADLYRLMDPGEVDELGLTEAEDAVVIVEWPDRAPGLERLPGLSIAIAIPPSGEGRTLSIRARGEREMEGLASALAPWRRTSP